MPSMSAALALTRMTLSDALRQPITWLMTGISIILIIFSYVFGMFNFDEGDRLSMLCTAGVAATTLNGLFLAVVGASQAVHDELSSRTALTLFAKPMGRGAYLIGKALGIWLVVVISGLVLVGVHSALLGIAGQTSFASLLTIGGHSHSSVDAIPVPWAAVFTAHLLTLGHTAVMTCLATALALRLPLVANILLCFAIFVLGHVLAAVGISGAVAIPALSLYNVDDAVQLLGKPVSATYVASAALYTALFCAGCLTVGTALFRRQDIP